MALAPSRFVFGSVPWYGFLIVLGIILAYFIGMREEKRVGLPTDTMTDVTLVAVPCGIIGSRLYYAALEWGRFAQDPIRILYLWEGGVAIYGAVIGGMLGVYLYCRKKKLSFAKVLDIVAPGLLLAQAIGRWGNYFNLEAYGPVLVSPALQFFPMGVLIPQGDGFVWHAATFFYESMWNLAGVGALWLLRKRQKQDGNLFLWYLLLYGCGRFVIEQLRTDSLYLWGLKASQWLSLGLLVFAAGMLLARAGAGKPKALALSGLLTAAALPRWLLADSPFYGVPLLAVTVLWAACLLWQRREQPRVPFASLWFCIPWTLDVACFVIAQLGVFSLSRALQMAVASLTFPCYCLWLTGWLSRVSTKEKEEPHARRSLQK